MILDQLYCELMLNFKLNNNMYNKLKPSEARRIAQEIIEKFKSERGLIRFPIAAELESLYFVISPDVLIVKQGKVITIIRARLRETLKVYEADFALLYLAGLILDKQELLADNAKLMVIVSSGPEPLKHVLRYISNKEIGIHEIAKLIQEDVRIVTRIYQESYALLLFEKIVGFWKGERAPIISNSIRKCLRCPFRDSCLYFSSR